MSSESQTEATYRCTNSEGGLGGLSEIFMLGPWFE
jgi:hypothetical protein